MKKLYKSLVTLIFMSLCQLTFATDQKTPTLTDNEPSIYISSSEKIKTTLINENLPELKATINVAYPQIIGKKLSLAAQQFNTLMQEKVTHEMDQFKKYVKQDLAHMQTLPPEVQNNSLDIDYDIDLIHPNHNTIIMVRINIEGMQAGRAHPYHVHHVFNYDLNKGKVLALADLFKHKANYLKLIAEYTRKQLLKNASDGAMVAMVKQGTKVDPKNFKNWNIQNDTLLITFDEYQVAPYINGPQEVEIPYSALKKIIAPDSVINACVVNPESCGVS